LGHIFLTDGLTFINESPADILPFIGAPGTRPDTMQEKPALPQPQQKVVRGTGMHSDATYGVETAV
jgi:hypothetical protein